MAAGSSDGRLAEADKTPKTAINRRQEFERPGGQDGRGPAGGQHLTYLAHSSGPIARTMADNGPVTAE